MLRREQQYRGLLGSVGPTFPASPSWWLRADQGITLIAGAVSQWDDISGSADLNKNAVQAVAVNRPTFTAVDLLYNSQPLLVFDGVNSFMTTPVWAVAVAQPYTLVVIGNDSGAAAAQIYVEGGAVRSLIYNNAASYEIFAGANLSAGVTSNAPRMLGALVSGGSSLLYNNAITPAASGNAGVNSPWTNAYLGQTFANTARLAGKLAEIILWPRALTPVEWGSLRAYFTGRYGIAIGP